MTNKDLADSILRLEDKVDNLTQRLDELTGAKKFLMWFTGVFSSAGIIIATWLGVHHK